MSEFANLRIGESANGRMRGWLRRFVGRALIVLAVCALTAMPAWAQKDGLSISVSKQFGYNLGSQIQGTFKIRVRGPEDLAVVTCLIDAEPLGEATSEPFEFTFKTGDYAPGWHTITAVGTTTGGQTLTARTLNFQFVTAQAAGEGTAKLIVPIVVFALIATIATAVFPMLGGRKKAATTYDPASYVSGEPRNYGVLGGVVCPKCGRPFGMHWWGFNVLAGKYDRCPHCGKWSVVRRASREALMEAEAAEYAAHTEPTPKPVPNAEEKLREQLEDSRFIDRI